MQVESLELLVETSVCPRQDSNLRTRLRSGRLFGELVQASAL